MNCPQCSNTMVEAKATNFGDTYQYCRTCKKELAEILKDTPTVDFHELLTQAANMPVELITPPDIYVQIFSSSDLCWPHAGATSLSEHRWSAPEAVARRHGMLCNCGLKMSNLSVLPAPPAATVPGSAPVQKPLSAILRQIYGPLIAERLAAELAYAPLDFE